MAVCGSIANFTLVTPVSSPPCPEKIMQGNYLCTRTYHTGTSFELIFMKFAYLMLVHPLVNPIVFGNNQLNRTIDMGENVTPKPVFWFSFSRYGIFMKKTYKQYLVPHSPQKRFSSFLSSDAYFALSSCAPKTIFRGYFGKYVFFLKKLFNEKYLKPHFPQKRLYWFLALDAPFPLKESCPPIDGFLPFFQKIVHF